MSKNGKQRWEVIMKNRIYYIDFLRVFLCISIFLYHTDVLKGGYLAVCSFFVLSGYLSAMSLKKEKFSILSYYKSRFLRLYVPLILVVFVSLAICMIILPDMIWVSMKREVMSIFLGYNNFWQLSANMDYFARHVDSPYMHLWYVAILLQLELIFPLIYGMFRTIKNKYGYTIPIILSGMMAGCSVIWFLYLHFTNGLMSAYYNTFTRCFAWFAGIAVGLCHIKKGPAVWKKVKDGFKPKVMLYLYILLQILLFIFASAESKLYLGAMLITTLIACRLIDYANIAEHKISDRVKHIVEYFSNISYEVFLVQYPVIFMFQYAEISAVLKYILVVVSTLTAAVVLNMALHLKKEKLPAKIISIALLISLCLGTVYGCYRYIKAPDLQAEQERLEKEMARLEEEQRIKQQEYEEQQRIEAEARKKEEEELQKKLEAAKEDINLQIELLDRQIAAMKDTVSNMPITFVGDSVLLGASDVLYQEFPKCYIDAEISRTAYAINSIFVDLKSRGILGNPVVINCGANGDCPDSYKDAIMTTLLDKQVFWLTSTNNTSANESLIEYAENFDNLHVIDWDAISEGHSEYFAGDGIHLQQAGKIAYSQAVMDAICEYYISEIETEKLELEKERDNLKVDALD